MLSHLQLIRVLWELGAVVIGVYDVNSNCSGGAGAGFLIRGDHLHHNTGTGNSSDWCFTNPKYDDLKMKGVTNIIITDSWPVLSFSHL